MCLVVVALDVHPRFSLVIAANRDEYHARPAAPAAWGRAAPFAGILAGRDLSAGGTWFGVRRDGRWGLVTNFREGQPKSPEAPSRGDLVPQVLNAADLDQALAAIHAERMNYNGYSLLAGSIARAAYASNRAEPKAPLAAGLHGLSNAALDAPWPKLVRARQALARWIDARGDDPEPLFAALADRRKALDAALPATGVTIEWERTLSAPFIVGETYGTRCSTVLTIDREGRAEFRERSFDAAGAANGEIVESFTLG